MRNPRYFEPIVGPRRGVRFLNVVTCFVRKRSLGEQVVAARRKHYVARSFDAGNGTTLDHEMIIQRIQFTCQVAPLINEKVIAD